MASYKLELGNHPSQARHPVTREPLFDDQGNRVPRYPNRRAVYIDGTQVAYVSEAGHVAYLTSQKRLGAALVAEIEKLIADEFKPVGNTSFPIEIPEEGLEADDD